MSPARVLVAVVLATVLLVAAFFVLRRPGAVSDTPVALLQFDPAKAVGLTVTRPDGSSEAVKRGEAAGEWVIEVTRGGVTSVWPAASGNVRAAFRLLAQIEGSRRADTGSALGADTTLVEVGLEDGQRVSMRIDGRVLAGKVLAQTELPLKGAPVWIDASFADMLVKAGPREWRDARVLPEMAEASRITLVSGATTIGLARVQGRWGVREPVVEAAEPEAITRLAGGLAAVQIIDFLDAGFTASETGLEAPVASVTLEVDHRDPDTAQSRIAKSELRIGQPSNMSGKGVFAQLTRPGLPGRTVVVSAEPLAGLSRDPSSYVSKRSVSTPAADIAAITVGDQRYARSLEGWLSRSTEGQIVRVTTQDEGAISAVLKLLTETAAESVAVEPVRSGVPPEPLVFAVSIEDVRGGVTGPLTVEVYEGVTPAVGNIIGIRGNGVLRRYHIGEEELRFLMHR